MTYTVTITSQGQLSLPAKIRKELGFLKSKKVIVSVQGGKVVLEPVKDLLELGGSIKSTKKPLKDQGLHDFYAKSVAKQYGKVRG